MLLLFLNNNSNWARIEFNQISTYKISKAIFFQSTGTICEDWIRSKIIFGSFYPSFFYVMLLMERELIKKISTIHNPSLNHNSFLDPFILALNTSYESLRGREETCENNNGRIQWRKWAINLQEVDRRMVIMGFSSDN